MSPRSPEWKRINLMEEKDVCHGSQLPQGPTCWWTATSIEIMPATSCFPILDFSTSWVFLWPPGRLTSHWAAPGSPESFVLAPPQDQRKSLETVMETSVVCWTGSLGRGLALVLSKMSWSSNPWIPVGRPSQQSPHSG